MAVERYSIDGLETYHEIVPGMKTVDVELIVRVGSLDEPDDLAGICHALEHCTHLRTPSFDGQPAIDRFANKHSFYRNADTYYTRTKYYGKGLEAEAIFKLIGELTTGAVFEPNRVAEEMKSIRREAKTDLDDIENLDYCFYDYVLFGKPYGREILGYHDRLDFSAEQLRDFYEKYYTLPNMVLFVVGDIAPDEVRRLATRFITGNARTGSQDRPALSPAQKPHPAERRYGFVREDSTNARLCLQVAVPPDLLERDDKAEPAYSAARSLISKAVIDEVRYTRALSYDGSFSIASYNHRSACRLRADVTVDTGDINAALETLRSVLARDSASYADEAIEEALAKLRISAAEDVDQVMDRTGLYIGNFLLGNPVVSAEQLYERLEATTVADVREALADTLGVWHNGEVIECVTGPKAAVGDRFVIEQSTFA